MDVAAKKYIRDSRKLTVGYTVPVSAELKEELVYLKNYYNVNAWIRDLIETHINELKLSMPQSKIGS